MERNKQKGSLNPCFKRPLGRSKAFEFFEIGKTKLTALRKKNVLYSELMFARVGNLNCRYRLYLYD